MPAQLWSARSLWEAWTRHERLRPDAEAIVHWRAADVPFRWTWRRLLNRAREYGDVLSETGVQGGDVCAIVVRHHVDFYPLYMGIESIGAIPAVLAYPNARLHPDKFREGLVGMAQHSGLDWLLTEVDLEPVVRPLATMPGSSLRGVVFPFEREPVKFERRPVVINADAPCLLQHSSGTTGLQKPVMLSHRAVLGHLEAYAQAIHIRDTDKVVSWLPLYHDMGLIAAFHLPLAHGLTAVHIDPFEWVGYPALLLEAISRERGTLTWLPNFAFNVLADRVQDDELDGLRLDSLRLVVNCSEPVRAESHERFATRFASHGFRRQALAACYAMAETTFAVCQTKPGHEPRVLAASRRSLSAGIYATAEPGEEVRACVSSGEPIRGCVVRTLDADGRDLGDGQVGALVMRSASMFDGYRNEPERTAAVLTDGWYHSGDLGFRLDGEYFVIGRQKDLIIVAGKNIYPEDLEDAISAVSGVLPGRVVACGVENAEIGTEEIWIIAETAVSASRFRELELEIVRAGMAIDVTLHRVVLVEPRWLIKSSAGKPSRRASLDRLLRMTPSLAENAK